MKKVLIIGLIVAIALIFVGGVGVVYARVSGLQNNAAFTVTTTNNGNEVTRQFSYGSGTINGTNPDDSCPYGTEGECGLRIGPGGMMQGFGRGGMMQGYGYGGMMGGRGNENGWGKSFGNGMMNGRGLGVDRGEGLMHDTMISAFAESVDLTVDEVETRLANGESLKEIAIAQGITNEELPDLITNVRKAALDAAVADGTLTQAQADVMLEHMDNYMAPGFGLGFGGGFGDCPMMDGDEFQQP